jgi:hypothetical protein
MVAQLPSASSNATNGTRDVWLYGSDLWTGDVKEGKAGSHWEPLTFLPNGEIEPLNCYSPQYEIDIQTAPANGTKDIVADATISSAPGNYTWACDLGVHNKNYLYQFFQATKSGTITEFGLNLAQQG